MSVENKNIGFILRGIKTEQFAIIDSAFKEGLESQVTTDFRYAVNFDQRKVIVLTKFTYEQDKVPFIVLDISCHFEIEDNSWESLVDDHKIVIPQNFATHLLLLSVGTARGVLHAKTENSVFNQFLIPTINLLDIVTTDIIIEKIPANLVK